MKRGYLTIAALMLFIIFGVQQVHAQAFTEPTDLPPGGSEVAPPLNTSSTTQTKQGNLRLDGPNPVRLEIGNSSETGNSICLNGVCKTDLFFENYILLQDGPTSAGSTQGGFTKVSAKSGQQYAIYAEGSEPTTDWTAGLFGTVASAGSGPYKRYGVVGQSTSNDELAVGVYGYSEFDAAYAGYFDGRVRVAGDLLISPYVDDAGATQQSKICLNDPGNESQCVTEWPFSLSGQFVRLQKVGTPTLDDGSLNISGSGTFSSIVLGTAPANTPFDITCGDGVCQPTSLPAETVSSCPIDCFAVTNISVQKFVNSATISWITTEPTTGSVDFGPSTFYSDDVVDTNFAGTHGPLTMNNLQPDTTYFYRIISVSESGAVASSNCSPNPSCSFRTLPTDLSPPSTVQNLRINGSVAWDSIPIAWDAASDNVAILHYILERNDGTGFVAVGGNIIGTSYTDTAVIPSKQYTYRVKAVDTALNPSASYSATLIVTTPAQPADTTPPSVPAGVSVVGTAYYDNVDLQWSAVPDADIKEYNVYRKLTSEPDTEWKFIVAVAQPTLTYKDVGLLTPDTDYDYAVSAVDNDNNESDRSAKVTASIAPDTTSPGVPGTVSIQNLGTTRLSVSWQKSAGDTGGSGLAGYRLYRYDCTLDPHPDNDWLEECNPDPAPPPGVGWTLIVQTSVLYWYDSSIISGRQYQYRVTAYDNAGNESTATTPTKEVYVPYDACTSNNQCTNPPVPNSTYSVCCNGVCTTGCGSGDGGGHLPPVEVKGFLD
ncbi:MAG: hypothetical protein WC266_02975 [Patescibacteria group bacterium]|jgi:fibronectin type 3 domain-containing protein